MATVGRAEFELAVDSAKFRSDLQRAARDFSQFTGGIESTLRGLSFVAAAEGMRRLVMSALNAADAIEELASQTGLGIEQLQELQFAAVQSGIGAEKLASGLGILNTKLTDAFNEVPAAVEAFKRLGVSAEASGGGIKNLGDILPEIAQGFKNIKSPAEQAALARDLFGRGGTAFLLMLKDGAEGLKEFARQAHEYGAVTDATTVKETAKARDEIDKLAQALKTDLIVAIAAVIPAIKEITGTIRELSTMVSNFFASFRSDTELNASQLEQKIKDVQARLEGLRATSEMVGTTGGFLIPRPKGQGNQKLIADAEAELARLQELLQARQEANKQAEPVISVTGAGPFALTEKQKQDIIKGWVDVADAIYKEDEELFQAEQKIRDALFAAEQKLQQEGLASTIAAAEADFEASESALLAEWELRKQLFEQEQALIEEGRASQLAAIEAELAAEEDLAAQLRKIDEERGRPGVEFEQTIRQAREEANAFGTSLDETRVRLEALKVEMREFIRTGRGATEEFAALKAEFDELRPFIAFKDVVTEIFQSFENALTTSIKGVILGTQTLDEALRNLGQNVGLSLLETGMKRSLDAMEAAIQEFLTKENIQKLIGFFISLGSMFAGAGAGPAGATTVADFPTGMAAGGIVTRPSMHMLGESGPEAVIPLDQLSGGGMEVNVYAPPGSQVQQRSRTGPNGRQIRDIMISAVGEALGNGTFDSTLKGSYGLSRRGLAR